MLGLVFQPNLAQAVDNNLLQVRCHMYFDGDRPVRLRLALDFQLQPEKMILKKSQEPYKNSLQGFIEDYIAVKENGNPLDITGNVDYKYGNTKDLVNVRIISDVMRISINEKYEMRGNNFNYVPTTKVSYVDIDIIRRINKPEKPKETAFEIKPPVQNKPVVAPTPVAVIDSAVTDTVFIEKTVHDTIIKVVHDTVFVDKIVYISKNDNKLTGISCEHLTNWWNDPHYRIDFKFSEAPIELTIETCNEKLNDAPANYITQYKIIPSEADCGLFFENIEVKYTNCDNNILLMYEDEEYFLLAKAEIKLQPHEFAYDYEKKLSYIRIRY